MTDHRAEAESVINLDDPTVSQVQRVFRAIGLDLAFGVSIPDPDAHQVEDAGAVVADVHPQEEETIAWLAESCEGPGGLMHARALGLIQMLQRDLAEARAVGETTGRQRDQADRRNGDLIRKLADVEAAAGQAIRAEARAARPALIRPEVAAVVEAAQVYAAAWVQRSALDERVALLDAVRALPEDWRDGAAAVPAVLDEAGIERVAAKLAADRLRLVWDRTSPEAKAVWREDAKALVRAYLGATDTGSES